MIRLPGNPIHKFKFLYSSYENYANFCFSQEYLSKATGARNTPRDNYGIVMNHGRTVNNHVSNILFFMKNEYKTSFFT